MGYQENFILTIILTINDLYCLENLIRYIIITMVTEFNSVHKHSESPPHCGDRESEIIADYLLES